MAGHSKWANIKHKKQKEDRRRAKLFSKLSKRIAVAAREGGGDPEMNAELRMVIDKARDNNMPNENIERAIKRGTGELEGVDYESFDYEGYGPEGVALYLEITTDNRNRAASEIRHILSENGGNLGESGCVAWMFDRKGQLVLDNSNNSFDEDEVLLEALEAGAEDVKLEGEIIRILTDPKEFMSVKEELEENNFEFKDSDIVMLPNNTVDLDKSGAKKILNLMDELEEHDDVQEIYANFNIPESVLEEIENEE
ncbi:YebC/PmpR family DNA-binding transcriptional regulator [Halanaerobiaceae bacterium Z-7014]|uniref:Probable transcriptional regulatory protein I0Q91_03005 n=1 Tax=Halonatronomonas betaini TaxID=2778430 RepID=A0A931APD9_9FIRM|nr:YebC/PmpR family DNA-binding transcriptional regulator [Halonatronomonas betaini]MBF8436037.1 YebC/PmpR family DNA-binding transcriptional regulator [Halonatronomonas betaini]